MRQGATARLACWPRLFRGSLLVLGALFEDKIGQFYGR
jgi:hypothetical protein